MSTGLSSPGRRVPDVSERETYEDEDFAGVDWYGMELGDGRYVRCRFFDADLTEARTQNAIFEECDFSGARLNASRHRTSAFLRCTFSRASLFDATLDGCKLTGSEFASTRLRPLTVHGGDWSYVGLRGADLAGLDLSAVNLAYADLTEADLRKTVLRDANLDHARLELAELRGADLRGADLNAVETRTLDLRDVKVTMIQAIVLAQHRGAVVDG